MAMKKKAKKSKKKAAPARKAKKPLKKAKSAPKVAAKKGVAKKAVKKKAAVKRPRGRADAGNLVGYRQKGLGAFTGGQSGDLQSIRGGAAGADSESVEELLEEGQTFEAEAVAGVENAADPDVSEVVTRQVPEDDVPEEYREKDE